MCYKIPHLWSCNHTYAWSPVHCTAATARRLEPSQHCEHLIEPEDPEWKIREEMVCPDCQRKERESSESEGGGKESAADKGKEDTGDKALEHELAALERELEDLEMGDLEAALRESAHHHTLLHDTHLEEAKKNSLAENPSHQQSLDAHVEEMSKAKAESVRHWEEELGMGVYRDHERAVQRARLESYRELLEGYRRFKGQLRGGVGEGEGGGNGVGKEGGEGVGDGIEAGPPTPRSLSTATPTPTRKQRWAFQDEDHRDLYEDDNDASSARSSTGRVRHASGEGVAVDPAESFARRPTSHASSQPAADEEEGAQPGLVLPGDKGDDGGEQRHRRRSLLKRLRPGGGEKK